jgi:hypothetical protein
MLAEPIATPVIVGCVDGVVDPAAMVTVAGEIVSVAGSVLLRVTVVPPVGAADDRLIGNVTVCKFPTEAEAGRFTVPALATVTVAVVFARVAALALMVVVPKATPVTGTLTLVVFAAMVTVAGTAAIDALVELRLITWPPAGAADDRTKLRFLVLTPGTVSVEGTNAIFAAT